MKTICCPNCGNENRDLIEDNGLPKTDLYLAYLCVAKVPVKDRSWKHCEPDPDQVDSQGRVDCGMQWEPCTEQS